MKDRAARGTVYSPVTERVAADLKDILGPSGVTVDSEKCAAYSADETLPWFERDYPAEAVCFPQTTEQVSSLMSYANRNMIPVTPRGAGTGLSGGAVPALGGIVLSMERMNRIIEVDEINRTLTAEPGVITAEITKAAREHGMLYAGDPCSGDISFIGGNVAENAGGNKVIKYGATGAHVLGLEVVLPDGRVTAFGGKRRKDVTGYDFIRLIVGSEGTLAVVTKIILNLLPLPKCVMDLLAPMPDIESAVRLASLVATKSGVMPSSIEFMDRQSILNVEKFTGIEIPFSASAAAYLIIQVDGMEHEQLWRDAHRVGDVCVECGALEVFVGDDRNARDRIWEIRHLVAEEEWTISMPLLSKEDIVIPCGAIPAFMDELPGLAERHRASYNAYGHIGDGNIHMTVFPAEEDGRSDLFARADAMRLDLYHIVRRLGGALSGEHGIGLKRAKYSPIFLGETCVDLIKNIKRAFDPNHILNPGKIIP
ncbi:MAG: FAD-binding oxidoreductase [Synergistaceae bacterium]|nr:FAD-binding oxidoreductase [Synergistaceae bacterium]